MKRPLAATVSRFQAARHWRQSLLQAGLNAIFPPRCAGCGWWCETLFCRRCAAALHPLETPQCAICGIPFPRGANVLEQSECAQCRENRYHQAPPFTRLRSLYHFEGPLREAIHRFKYQGKTALAEPLGDLLHAYLRRQHAQSTCSAIPPDEIELVTAVPLHPWRRWRRGFNQSELLARALARHLNCPSWQLLRRVRHTVPQAELPALQRAANLHAAFAAQADIIRQNYRGGAVLLIDDVCTTGATVRECAATLKQSGVAPIYALTLARRV